jgi:hypothetical protein
MFHTAERHKTIVDLTTEKTSSREKTIVDLTTEKTLRRTATCAFCEKPFDKITHLVSML